VSRRSGGRGCTTRASPCRTSSSASRPGGTVPARPRPDACVGPEGRIRGQDSRADAPPRRRRRPDPRAPSRRTRASPESVVTRSSSARTTLRYGRMEARSPYARAGRMGRIGRREAPVRARGRSPVPLQDRCSSHGVLPQWSVRVEPLAGAAGDAVPEGPVRISPPEMAPRYFERADNMHDRCIYRQSGWGQRIPVGYDPGGETMCVDRGEEGPGSWTQDTDVDAARPASTYESVFSIGWFSAWPVGRGRGR
jgi:tRNA synthetases class I (I, L, M and V)